MTIGREIGTCKTCLQPRGALHFCMGERHPSTMNITPKNLVVRQMTILKQLAQRAGWTGAEVHLSTTEDGCADMRGPNDTPFILTVSADNEFSMVEGGDNVEAMLESLILRMKDQGVAGMRRKKKALLEEAKKIDVMICELEGA